MSTVGDLLRSLGNSEAARRIFDDLGLSESDQITPSSANPAIGDMPNDGQVSFYVDGAEHSGFLLIDDDGEIRFFNNDYQELGSCILSPGHRIGSACIFASDISGWASRIDPKRRFSSTTPEWPSEIQSAEQLSSERAREALTQLSGREPEGLSALQEFTNLPVGHPAKEFLEEYIISLGEVEELNEYQLKEALEIFMSMKSVKAFYETGKTIWKRFPHMHDMERIKVLYQRAGSHVGAIAAPMGLIDQGARAVDVIFTDIDESVVANATRILERWSQTCPHLEFNPDTGVTTDAKGNKKITLRYKGREITITFKMMEVGGLSLDPTDVSGRTGYRGRRDPVAPADVIIVHDPFSLAGAPDALILTEALYHIPKVSDGNPQAIVITNELDDNIEYLDGETHYDSVRSILPLRGWRAAGSFGCGADYVIGKKLLPEIGRSYAKSALIFSTHSPLMRILRRHDIFDSRFFLNLALLAGGSLDITHNKTWMKKTVRGGPDDPTIEAWVNEKIGQLPEEDREYLLLVTIRYLVLQTGGLGSHEQERLQDYIKTVPPELKEAIAKTLVSNGLAPEGCTGDEALRRISEFTPEDLRRLDEILMKKQQMD